MADFKKVNGELNEEDTTNLLYPIDSVLRDVVPMVTLEDGKIIVKEPDGGMTYILDPFTDNGDEAVSKLEPEPIEQIEEEERAAPAPPGHVKRQGSQKEEKKKLMPIAPIQPAQRKGTKNLDESSSKKKMTGSQPMKKRSVEHIEEEVKLVDGTERKETRPVKKKTIEEPKEEIGEAVEEDIPKKEVAMPSPKAEKKKTVKQPTKENQEDEMAEEIMEKPDEKPEPEGERPVQERKGSMKAGAVAKETEILPVEEKVVNDEGKGNNADEVDKITKRGGELEEEGVKEEEVVQE
jgi:hypothetical protein